MRGDVGSLDLSGLIDAWERAWPDRPIDRVLAILRATSGLAPRALAGESLGRRDRRLLALRQQLFGSKLECLADCPACGESLEFACDAGDLTAPFAEAREDAGDGACQRLDRDGYQVHYRVPVSSDLQLLEAGEEPSRARRRLLDGCVLEARRAGERVSVDDLPAGLVAELCAGMAATDAQADVVVALRCPACDVSWRAGFDIGGYLWTELEAWVQRTLVQVHSLASRYGWSEREILSMTPWRRQVYQGFADR